MPMQVCCPLRDEIEVRSLQDANSPIRHRVTKLHDWFALVNKYLRGKIMRTSLPLTEIWPISNHFIKQKYYCITVHYRTVCTSENSWTNCPNWTANSRTSGTFFGLCPMADAKLNPCIDGALLIQC